MDLARNIHTNQPMARKAETPRSTYLKTQFEFIVTELDLALTFWDIANSTLDEGRATRNLKHAKKPIPLRFIFSTTHHWTERGGGSFTENCSNGSLSCQRQIPRRLVAACLMGVGRSET